jgi:hypothetical protein
LRWLRRYRFRFRGARCTPRLEQLEDRLVPAFQLNPVPVQVVLERQPVTVQVTTPPQVDAVKLLFFSLTQSQPGAVINPETGVFQWTPAAESGPAGFSFTVQAINKLTKDIGTVTFQVVVLEADKLPVFQPVANQTVAQGTPVALQAAAFNNNGFPGGIIYSLPAAPAGASIDPKTGAFQWTPAANQGPGIYAVTVRAANGIEPELFAQETILITVTPTGAVPAPGAAPALGALLPLGASDPPPIAQGAAANAVNLTNSSLFVVYLEPGQKYARPPAPGPDAAVTEQNSLVDLGAPVEVELAMDRLLQKPLKLTNTEANSDGSSVERLYKDFLGPQPVVDQSATTDAEPAPPQRTGTDSE